MNRYRKLLGIAVLTAGVTAFAASALFGQEPNPMAQTAARDQPQIEKQDNGIYLYRV